MKKIIFLAFFCLTISYSLMPRQAAPHFTAQAVLPDLSFKILDLDNYAGKYIVLLFYPFDFTYVCPT
jgi:alkyl hydroperoxide reductase subunit AhpC